MVEYSMNNDVTTSFGIYGVSRLENKILNFAHSLPAHDAVAWAGLRMAQIAKRAFLYAHAHPIVDAKIDELKMRLYLTDNSIERKFLFTPQFFDVAERKYLTENLPEDGIFVDVGSNAGIYTMTACKAVGKKGKVLAIDHSPVMLQRMKYNANLNGFDETIIAENISISDKPVGSKENTLLDVIKKYNLPRVDALRIGIEGAEDKALVPFFRDVPKELLPKFMIVENSTGKWKEDLIYALQRAGYDRIETTAKNQIWLLEVLDEEEENKKMEQTI